MKTQDIKVPELYSANQGVGKKERDVTFDLMKGVAILIVIVAHLSDDWKFNMSAYTFHMPLFFILAGIFFTPRQPLQTFKKDFQRLVVPFIILGVIYVLMGFAMDIKHGDFSFFHTFDELLKFIYPSKVTIDLENFGGATLWFLFALFWCKTFYNVLSQKVSGIDLVTICLALSLFAMYLQWHHGQLPLAIFPGIGALFFFALGDFFSKMTGRSKKYAAYFIVIAALGWAVFVYTIERQNMSMIDNYYESFVRDVIVAIGGTATVWWLCNNVFSRVKYLNKFLAFCGVNSMIIFCVHAIDVDHGLYVKLDLFGSEALMILLAIGIYIGIAILLSYSGKMRKLFGITRLS